MADQMWRGVIAMLNTWTDDDRRIDAFSWRDLPLTLRAQLVDNGGHSNAVPAARVDRIWFEGQEIWGEGIFSASDDGNKYMGLVGERTLRGVSVDPARYDAYDVIIAGDGTEVPIEEWWAYPAGMEPWPEPFKYATIFTEYECAAITGVANPAFREASIELIADPAAAGDAAPEAPITDQAAPAAASLASTSTAAGGSMVLGSTRFASKGEAAPMADIVSPERRRLIASGAWRPPVDAFRKRDLTEFTPFRIDDSTTPATFSGHAYMWEGEHRGYSGTPLHPPRSTDFTQFLTGAPVTCDDGSTFHVGVLTHKGGHGASRAEYNRIRENPENQLGPCLAYADEFGVQVCGVVWPDIDGVELSRTMTAYPSGDWGWKDGEQKLFGVAMVNNPGFHSLDQPGQHPLRLVASFARAKAGATAATMSVDESSPSTSSTPGRRRLSAAGLLALKRADAVARPPR